MITLLISFGRTRGQTDMRALPQTHSVKQFKLFTLSSADEEEYFQKTAPLNKGRFMQYN